MGNIEKVVFIKNAVETLGYFSEQIALEMEHMGMDIYFIDYDDMFESLEGLRNFAGKGNTVLFTFNFIGLSGEEVFLNAFGAYLWEEYEMSYLNILVDHPLYYHSKLEQAPSDMTVFCIDREHVGYIRRFYPDIQVRFLPIAGNILLGGERQQFLDGNRSGADTSFTYRDYDSTWNYEKELIPYENRAYDLVFTANYVPLQNLCRRFSDMEPEYETFYRGILDDLICAPQQSVDAVMERHIVEEIGEVSETDKRAAMSGMLLIDLCARTYFRGKIIRELAEADIKVHVFGADWELLECKKPRNIIKNGGQVDSRTCVQAMGNAKLALNIMPWFKDGAHDRIFTAMLQKTAALTDGSRYLWEEFKNGDDIAFYSLEDLKALPERIRSLLENPKEAMRIAENGYRRAYAKHTWRERAQEIVRYFPG